MATTTNYGWTTPDDTALVKDGASAIRSLGSAIDTSLNTALGTKKSGLVLLNTTSFSAVSSQSINSIFSSTYDNYRIMIKYNGTGTSVDLNMRLRLSGTDASGANTYKYEYLDVNTTTIGSAAVSTTLWSIGAVTTAVASWDSSTIIDLFAPAKAEVTSMQTFNQNNITSGFLRLTGGTHTAATAYDGFTIYPGAGNITGSLSVYGYNK